MSQAGDIPIADFRQAGERAIDWIARYLSRPDDFPVLARVAPREIKAALPESAPEQGEPLDSMIDRVEEAVRRRTQRAEAPAPPPQLTEPAPSSE